MFQLLRPATAVVTVGRLIQVVGAQVSGPGSRSGATGLETLADPLMWISHTSGYSEAELLDCYVPQLEDIGVDDRVLLCGDIRHWQTAALAYGAIRTNCTVYIVDVFVPQAALAMLDAQAITVSDWQPWQLSAVVALSDDERQRYLGATHRVAWVGGARVEAGLRVQLERWWGTAVYEHFGGQHWLGACVADSEIGQQAPNAAGRWRSGSQALNLLVLGPDRGPRRVGQIGELAVQRLDQPGGVLLTGELGYMDCSELFYSLGPIGNALETADGWLSGVEGERVLENHPGVREAAFLALDETTAAAFGFEAGFCAVVTLGPELENGNPLLEIELLAYCRARLSQAKSPMFVLFVAALPLLPSGAVDVAALASSAASLQVNIDR